MSAQRTFFAAMLSLAFGLLAPLASAEPDSAPSDQAPSILAQLAKSSAEAAQNFPKSDNPKADYGVQADAGWKIVQQYLDSKDRNDDRLVEELRLDFQRNQYRGVRNDILFALIAKDDDAALTAVLAVNCPEDRMGLGQAIEGAIAISDQPAMKRRGMLVLCDAWERSKSEANRERIVAALRRGFRPMGLNVEKDAPFIKSVRQWVANEQPKFAFNPDYALKGSAPFMRPDEIPLYLPASAIKPPPTRTVAPPTFTK
ncbi:hypothetical protein LOC68_13295 [Blastopirellula sp. JC732]|uniref:HEAT repeat domain-containing protein n=1 Tax=Blastopirellula sediminis TaxID=2894196 RepID=A0A9X1MML9_9BACT|nr:hypothetical protein [Blastopirellula sediminis]MCC9607336.1 hypothetical protein [Blastopirellula sediminis]MCC9629371.1 hypothetical protein [Blastopirellula sediminis]